MRATALFFIACVFPALPGCTSEKNTRLTLGGSYGPPSIFDTAETVTGTEDEVRIFGANNRDRSEWEPMAFVAHFDGVVHGHLLRVFPARHPNSPARAYGRFPSAGDVLDPQNRSYTNDLLYTIGEYGRSSIGSDYSFFYLLSRGELFADMMSPFPYKRTGDAGWSSGQPANEPQDEPDE